MKKREPKNNVVILSEARERKTKKDAKTRNAITLDKRERREIDGFKARQREVEAVAAPLNAAIREFLAELQERYSVTFAVSHQIDFEACQLIPIPEKEESQEASPE